MARRDRRDTILDAVERLVLRDGVHAVSMRLVAEEADVSLRLVQYYGHTKTEILETALIRLSQRSLQGWQRRLSNTDDPRSILDAFLWAAMPVNPEQRDFHRFGVSLEQLAVTDPDGIGGFYVTHIGAVIDTLADALAPGLGEAVATDIAEAALAFSHGLGTLLMSGGVTPERSRRLIDDYLDQLAATRSALRRR